MARWNGGGELAEGVRPDKRNKGASGMGPSLVRLVIYSIYVFNWT